MKNVLSNSTPRPTVGPLDQWHSQSQVNTWVAKSLQAGHTIQSITNEDHGTTFVFLTAIDGDGNLVDWIPVAASYDEEDRDQPVEADNAPAKPMAVFQVLDLDAKEFYVDPQSVRDVLSKGKCWSCGFRVGLDDLRIVILSDGDMDITCNQCLAQ